MLLIIRHFFLACLIAGIGTGEALAQVETFGFSYAERQDLSNQSHVKIPDLDQFQQFYNGSNLGFDKRDVWIMIPAVSVVEDYYLTIQPVHIDRVRVYTQDSGLVFDGGDSITSPRGLIPGGYTVPIDSVIADQNLFIQLSSNNIIQPYVSIERGEILFKRSLNVVLMGAIAISISLFYLAWASSSMIIAPSGLVIAFALRMIIFIVASMIQSGIARQLTGGPNLPPQDFIHNISALGYISVAQVFDYFLIKETTTKRLSHFFAAAVIFATIAKFFLFFTGEISAAMQTNNITALFSLLIGLTFALLSNRRGKKISLFVEPFLSRLVPIFYFLLQTIPLAVLFILAALNSRKYVEYADMAFFNYAIVPGGFIVYVLAGRQRQQTKMQRALQENADRLQRERQAELEKRRDIGNLLNMLTHEIKTPLATLQMAQAVGQVDDDILSKTTRAISQAVTQADRVEEIEQGKPLVEAINVNIIEAVKTAVTNNIGELSVDYEDQTLSVLTDPSLLQIILSNLITNAQKYTRRGMTPVVKVRSTINGVSIAVTNGMNKPLQASDRLTEKYYRDPTNQGESGTGLGLYIVQLLCDQLGHELEINTSSSEFTVTVTIRP